MNENSMIQAAFQVAAGAAAWVGWRVFKLL
jgi:hypothetical protein